MRIIAGAWRGRTLAAPPGQSTRPTADRVRETLFSMLTSRLGGFEDVAVADLFAGSGALGFEALSRGAARATFVERDRAALDAIRANAEKLGAHDRVRVIGGDGFKLAPAGPFDLILADPPYTRGSGDALVAAVAKAGWLAPGGWLAVETHKGDPTDPGPFTLEVERNVGRARLTLLTSSPLSLPTS